MGRKKVDRSDKVMQAFEITKPLKLRLEHLAERRGMTVSALAPYLNKEDNKE